jgi:hypothetical protein
MIGYVLAFIFGEFFGIMGISLLQAAKDRKEEMIEE